jgi:CheY-like chemotaxis protein
MTPRTRQTVLRYGVAVDGVILATGIGLLFPQAWLIAMAFFAATAVAQWKAPSGGVVAFVLSIPILLRAFSDDAQTIVVFFYVLACVSMLFGPLVWESWKTRRRDPARVSAHAERKERLRVERAARVRVKLERKPVEKRAASARPRSPKARYTVNLINQRVKHNAPRAAVSRQTNTVLERRPRLLLVERRRATAEAALPNLSQRGVEVEVVERWVDAVDELVRFKPDALFIDSEHPEADLIRRTIVKQSPATPLIFTGSTASAPFALHPFRWLSRPYDPAELERVARDAVAHPAEVLALR